jgi:Protein of unknown function (DUF3352)
MTRLRACLATACATAVAAFGLAACGEDDSAVSEGPASAVPADVPFYLEGVANLEDADNLQDALETLGVEDPAGKLGAELDSQLEAQGAPVSYTEDIEPLIGERVGFFVQTFESSDLAEAPTEGDGAVIVETTDEDGARDRIDQILEESGDPAEDATYNGVDYKLNPDGGDAVAVFDGFVVAGTEPSVQAAIDASNGDSLADSEEFNSELDALDSDPVSLAYAEPNAVLDQLEASGQLDAPGRAVVEQAAAGLLEVPAVFTIGADSEQVTFSASTGVAESAAQLPTEESSLLRELPGDAWAATAVPDVGAAIQQSLDQVSSTAGTAAPDFDKELQQETGLELGSLTEAIGDVAFFVRGTNPLDAGGGLVVEDLDPDSTSDALRALERLAESEAGPGERLTPLNVEGEGFAFTSPSLPQPVNVVQREGKLVIAYGDDATEDAFAPTETLGDSETFTSATDALGDYATSFFVDIGPALGIAEATGATADPNYASIQPYLEHLSYFVTGASVDDDRSRARAVVGLTD